MLNKYTISFTYLLILILGIGIYSCILIMINKTNNTKEEMINKEDKVLINKIETKNIEIQGSNKPLELNNKPEPKYKIYIVDADVVNIRKEPTTKSEIINKYKKNDKVTILKVVNNWGELKEGGYIHIDLLKSVY